MHAGGKKVRVWRTKSNSDPGRALFRSPNANETRAAPHAGVHFSRVPKQIYLHVGLHKTGTSFLQARVFPNLPGVRFVHPVHRLREEAGPVELFFFDMFFRNAACVDMEGHRAAIEAWFETFDEDKVLISSEAIVGWPMENHWNLRTNVDLLAEMFPEAQVLFMTRRQDQWAESAYRQILRSGFSTSIERYLNYKDGAFERYNIGLYHGPNLDARDLDWEKTMKYAKSKGCREHSILVNSKRVRDMDDSLAFGPQGGRRTNMSCSAVEVAEHLWMSRRARLVG